MKVHIATFRKSRLVLPVLSNHINPETPTVNADQRRWKVCNRSIIMQTAVYSIDCGLMYCVLIGLLCLHFFSVVTVELKIDFLFQYAKYKDKLKSTMKLG